ETERAAQPAIWRGRATSFRAPFRSSFVEDKVSSPFGSGGPLPRPTAPSPRKDSDAPSDAFGSPTPPLPPVLRQARGGRADRRHRALRRRAPRQCGRREGAGRKAGEEGRR